MGHSHLDILLCCSFREGKEYQTVKELGKVHKPSYILATPQHILYISRWELYLGKWSSWNICNISFCVKWVYHSSWKKVHGCTHIFRDLHEGLGVQTFLSPSLQDSLCVWALTHSFTLWPKYATDKTYLVSFCAEIIASYWTR